MRMMEKLQDSLPKRNGGRADRFVFADQTHTTNVRVVTETDAGKGLMKPMDLSVGCRWD